jgi:hypothetical protein
MPQCQELLDSLTPLQKAIFDVLYNNAFITREKLQQQLRLLGFFQDVNPASADRQIRQTKVDMIYLGIPIGSCHGDSDIEKNQDKKIQKGYFLIFDINSPDLKRALLEHDQKIETESKTKNALIAAVLNFPRKKERPRSIPNNQPSLFEVKI